MAPASDLSVMRFTVKGVCDDQLVVNTLTYVCNDPAEVPGGGVTSDTLLVDFLAELRTRYRDRMLAKLPPSYKVAEYRLQEVVGRTTTNGGQTSEEAIGQQTVLLGDVILDQGATVAGESAILPTFVTAVIRKITNDGSKYFRGRYAFGPVWEAQSDTNVLSSSLRDELNVSMNAMNADWLETVAAPITNTWKGCVYSPTLNHIGLPEVPQAYYYTRVITTSQTNQRPGIMRSRQRRQVGV